MFLKLNPDSSINYPYTIKDMKKDYPNLSFPSSEEYLDLEFLKTLGIFPVAQTPIPEYNPITQFLVDNKPKQKSKKWVRSYEVFDFPPEILERNLSDKKKEFINITQKRLDTFAQMKGYDNIMSCCTYASSAIPSFVADAQVCLEKRDETWAKLYEILASVESDLRPVPTSYSDFEMELPFLTWDVNTSPNDLKMGPPTLTIG